mgnify:CR=1 FL=1
MKQTDQWLHDNRDALIASLQNLIRFPSAKGPAAPGAPFGTAVRDCLAAALDLARELGRKSWACWPTWMWYPQAKAGGTLLMRRTSRTAFSMVGVRWTTKAPP